MRKYQTFYLPDNANQFDFSHYDYVIDCIDTVTAKLDLIYRCHEMNIPLLSCMGAAYKLDATQFRVTDIFKTINDPLAKVIRKKLRKTKIKHLKVVYRHTIPSSNAWVPAAAGLIAGGEAVKDLVKLTNTMRIRPEDEATSEPARIAHERAAKMLEEHKRLKAEKAAADK